MKQVWKQTTVAMLVALTGASAVLADVKVRLRSTNDFIVEDRSGSAALLTVNSGGSGKAVLGTGNGPSITDANQIPTKKYVDDKVAANKMFASYALLSNSSTFTTNEQITFTTTNSVGSDLTISTHADGHHQITVNTAGDYLVMLKNNKNETGANQCQNEFQVNGTTDYYVYGRTAVTAWTSATDQAIVTLAANDVITVKNSNIANLNACSTHSVLPGARLYVVKI